MKRIALSGKRGAGIFTIVSDEDYEYLSQWRWHLDLDGYVQRTAYSESGQTTVRMNRIVLARKLSRSLVPREESEHENRQILDNSRPNLRLASRSDNCINVPIRPNCTTGFKGVRPIFKMANTWGAYIDKDNTRIYIGCFSSKEEAAYVRDQFAIVLHGEFAYLNILDK